MDFGYSCETFEYTTEDGYVLEADRVAAPKKGIGANLFAPHHNPIILVPGILSECGTWFLNFPSQSPGYILADHGFDVWAMNTREIAARSRSIHNLQQNDDRYWQWSFNEIGRYDVAAAIDLVLNTTGAPKVTLLAFSQGFTSSLVLLSTRPEYNDKVRCS
ncbi:lipase member M-like [Dermacentor variabilis]|uniref:lipase member M-like n=1 Tax=Dermacentor variabilis TaxID=34621 RepID=UPI003F5BEBC0